MTDPRKVDVDAHKKRLDEFNSQVSDWHAYCPVCESEITGTLKQIREHGLSHGTKG